MIVSGKRSTPRPGWDYFPTPSSVTVAACAYVEPLLDPSDMRPWLDPAAGKGDLIRVARAFSPRLREMYWRGIEINRVRGDAAAWHADEVVVANALDRGWGDCSVFANPPFKLLDLFFREILSHHRKYQCWSVVFTPTCWWQAEKRAALQPPDYFLPLSWRPVFRDKAGAAHKGSQDFAWCVWAPKPTGTTAWERLPKPSQRRAPLQMTPSDEMNDLDSQPGLDEWCPEANAPHQFIAGEMGVSCRWCRKAEIQLRGWATRRERQGDLAG